MKGCHVANRTYYVMTFKKHQKLFFAAASVRQCLADLSGLVTGG
jgi:hypothetical protein